MVSDAYGIVIQRLKCQRAVPDDDCNSMGVIALQRSCMRSEGELQEAADK